MLHAFAWSMFLLHVATHDQAYTLMGMPTLTAKP